jgi:colicin import membrane protein
MERANRTEGFGDKLRALAFSLALHALCVLLLLTGLWWTSQTRPVNMPGVVIEATLVGPTAAPRARAGAAKPAPEPPKPEPASPPPKPEPVQPPPQPQPPAPQPQQPTPAEVQRQDQIEREKIAAIAQQKAEQAQREQEERHRQEQVLLEQEKQRKLEEQRKQEAQRKLDEQRQQLAELTKQREAAERKANLEKQRLQQLQDIDHRKVETPPAVQAEDEAPQAQTGAGGQDDDLAARYKAAIQAAVTNNWNRPDSAAPGLHCVLNIVQIPGGEVISAQHGSPCNADPATQNSIEQAVMKAAPLPYKGYEKVFLRTITFTFRYDG